MCGMDFFATKVISVSANTTKTLIQLIAATNVRPKIKRITVMAKGGATSDKPAKIVIMRQTADGTGTSLTLTKEDTDAAETLQTTAKHTYTVEPTSGSEIASGHINVFGGQFIYIPTQARGLLLNGGDALGVVVTTDSAASGAADFSITIDCEE